MSAIAMIDQARADGLAALIETTAQFYDHDNLAGILGLARRDPAGLRAALLADPLAAYMAGRTLDDMMSTGQPPRAPNDAAAMPCTGRGGVSELKGGLHDD